MDVRPTQPGDVPALQRVLDATELFPSDMLPDMLDDFLASAETPDLWLSCVVDGAPVGFCYATPEQLADGAWNMLALAVAPASQGLGYGARLVRNLEERLGSAGARILIADTSGSDGFAGTRAFYAKAGYTEESRIRDFWAQGDDKVTYWKSLI